MYTLRTRRLGCTPLLKNYPVLLWCISIPVVQYASVEDFQECLITWRFPKTRILHVFSKVKGSVSSQNCASWTSKCRSHQSRQHCLEFRSVRTSKGPAHGSNDRAGRFHLIFTICSMTVARRHLYCTHCITNAYLLQTYCTIWSWRTLLLHT